MEETSIVWSTESLFPDLHPTVVDTSHSRTLDASTCLRILLIPHSILFSFSLRARDSSPPPSLPFPFLSFPEEARSAFDEALVPSFVAKFIGWTRTQVRSFSSWIFSLGFVVTVLLQNIFESRGKTGLSTWGNRRGLPGGPRRLHSTVAPARSTTAKLDTLEKDAISYSSCLAGTSLELRKIFLKWGRNCSKLVPWREKR